ncbi:MAG TPA: UPF0175 family protein [Candidatus Nanoarchaeia archaeon]|nr:UPF0175 family protein [Candidatus Nanoarchaeia archaeon]
MKKMETIMSVRLPENDIELINSFAAEYNKDKSTAVRELVEMGRLYFAINEYIKGKASIGRTAELAGLSISETIDLLTDLGIKAKVDIQDYLESKKAAEKMFK